MTDDEVEQGVTTDETEAPEVSEASEGAQSTPRTARRRAGASSTGVAPAAPSRHRADDAPAAAEADAVAAPSKRGRRRADASVAAPEGPEPVATPRRSFAWVPAGVLFTLAVVLACVNAVLLLNKPSGASSDRDKLLASVKQIVPLITSYDYRHLDQDEAATVSHLAGQFKDDYTKSFETTVKKLAPDQRAITVGSVTNASITDISDDGTRATLLIYGQQNVSNVQNTTPVIQLMNLIVTVEKRGGNWLVTNLTVP